MSSKRARSGCDDQEPAIDAPGDVVVGRHLEDRGRDGLAVPDPVHVVDVRVLARRIDALDDRCRRRQREEVVEAADRQQVRVDKAHARVRKQRGVEEVELRVHVAIGVREQRLGIAARRAHAGAGRSGRGRRSGRACPVPPAVRSRPPCRPARRRCARCQRSAAADDETSGEIGVAAEEQRGVRIALGARDPAA